MTNEIWKPVSGYEDIYEVSNTGKVRSLDRMTNAGNRKGVELKQTLLPCGYLEVSLWKFNKGKHKRVHRLVADAFCEKAAGQDDVNHLDGNKLNNAARNLAWCTKSENMIHAYKNGLQTRTSKGEVRAVVCIDDGNAFATSGEAARFYGISVGTIKAQCERKSKGRTKTFRYLERRDSDAAD